MLELWARLDHRITGQYPNIRAVQEVIGASKNWPFSIRAYFDSFESQFFARQVIDVMFSDPHRLREIALRGHSSCIDPFFKLHQGLAKSLEIVKVIVSGGGGVTDLSVLKGFTKLRELTIAVITPYSLLIQLPLAQLTALHLPLPYIYPKVALSILRQCHSITNCSLGGSGADAFPGITTCLLPELTHLTLWPSHLEYAQFIKALVLPCWTHLYLKGFYFNPPWPTACTQRITQSGTLQLLELDASISTPHLEELFRVSPLLTELSVPRAAFSVSCLEGVASLTLLPRIRKLLCMVDSLDNFYAHLDMFERRESDSSHAAHIAEVTFVNNSGVQESELSGSARCKEMVRLGWKIYVIT